MKVIIVGGVAGGASCAARLRRLDEKAEIAVESVPGALNIPLPQLRSRLGELPRDREIHVICRSAQRAYYATRILVQNGFKAKNIAGGMLSRAMLGIAELK
jgi:rhodanese-related sulfurtransferase